MEEYNRIELKNLLIKKPKLFFDKIFSLLHSESSEMNDLLSLNYQFKVLERKISTNIVSEEVAGIERNKIIIGILSILDRIELHNDNNIHEIKSENIGKYNSVIKEYEEENLKIRKELREVSIKYYKLKATSTIRELLHEAEYGFKRILKLFYESQKDNEIKVFEGFNEKEFKLMWMKLDDEVVDYIEYIEQNEDENIDIIEINKMLEIIDLDDVNSFLAISREIRDLRKAGNENNRYYLLSYNKFQNKINKLKKILQNKY